MTRARRELEEREAKRRAESAKKRSDRNDAIRKKKADDEAKKKDRHAKQRTKGTDYQAKLREKTQSRLDNEAEKLSPSVTVDGESFDLDNLDGKEVNSTKAKRAKKRADDYRKKGKKLYERHGSGNDLENQAELRKTATRNSKGGKDAVALLERRANGGNDYTDKDKEAFDTQYKKELVKGGRTEQDADTIITEAPKLKRTIDKERKEKIAMHQKNIDPNELTARYNELTAVDKDGNSAISKMKEEGMDRVASIMSDGVITPEELETFNKSGNYELSNPVYDEDSGTWTGDFTPKDGVEGEATKLNVNQAQLTAMNKGFTEHNETLKKTQALDKKNALKLLNDKEKASYARKAKSLESIITKTDKGILLNRSDIRSASADIRTAEQDIITAEQKYKDGETPDDSAVKLARTHLKALKTALESAESKSSALAKAQEEANKTYAKYLNGDSTEVKSDSAKQTKPVPETAQGRIKELYADNPEKQARFDAWVKANKKTK